MGFAEKVAAAKGGSFAARVAASKGQGQAPGLGQNIAEMTGLPALRRIAELGKEAGSEWQRKVLGSEVPGGGSVVPGVNEAMGQPTAGQQAVRTGFDVASVLTAPLALNPVALAAREGLKQTGLAAAKNLLLPAAAGTVVGKVAAPTIQSVAGKIAPESPALQELMGGLAGGALAGGALGALGAGASKLAARGTAAEAARVAGYKPELLEAAKAAEAAGVPFTESALTGAGDEAAMRTLAPTSRAVRLTTEPFYEQQAQALRGLGEKVVGDVPLEAASAGEAVLGKIGAKLGEAEAPRKALEEQLAGVIPEGKNLGRVAASKVDQFLQERGVPIGEKGFDTEAASMANAAIDKPTAKALIAIRDDLAKAKSVKDLVNQKRNLDANYAGMFDDPSRSGVFTRQARGMINESIFEALGQKDQALAKQWKDVNAGFEDVLGAMGDLGLSQKQGVLQAGYSPEKIVGRVFGQGTNAVKALERAGALPEFRKAVLGDIWAKSFDGKNFVMDKFANAWKKISADNKKATFDAQTIKDIDNFITVGKFVENPQTAGGIQKTGGAQTAAKLLLGGAGKLGTSGLGAILGGAGGPLGAGIGAVAGPLAAEAGYGLKAKGVYSKPQLKPSVRKPLVSISPEQMLLAGSAGSQIQNAYNKAYRRGK